MSDMSVPAEKIAALSSAAYQWNTLGNIEDVPRLHDAARAVVDAVGTEDAPLCRCGHDKAAHEFEYSPVKGHCSHGGTNGVPECSCAKYRPVTPAPSPASDDAEMFEDELPAHIAESMKDPDYAAHHHWLESAQHYGTMPRVREAAYKAGFKDGFAAHMPAPDELTAQEDDRG